MKVQKWTFIAMVMVCGYLDTLFEHTGEGVVSNLLKKWFI